MNTYTLATQDEYTDWAGHQSLHFTPTERQALVIEAVAAALASELFYTVDVTAFCAARLSVDPVTLTHQRSQTMRVEGGSFGMDCYYARRYLDAVKARNAEACARAALKPAIGQRLGILMFSDYKRMTGCTITDLNDEAITLIGKRGSVTVTATASAMQIVNAQARAAERRARRAAHV